MRKRNYAGHVNIITPRPHGTTRSVRPPFGTASVAKKTLTVKELLVTFGVWMYFYLHIPRQGEPRAQAQVTRPQNRRPATRRRSQSPVVRQLVVRRADTGTATWNGMGSSPISGAGRSCGARDRAKSGPSLPT